jgi:hypothetical protein
MTLNYAREKPPFEYILTPRVMEKGTNWLTLKLKNIGQSTLRNLDVKLHSLDSNNLSIYGAWWFGAGQLVKELEPSKFVELVFQVNLVSPTDVYVTIKGHGYEDGNYWWWESGRTNIRVSDEKAELLGLLVLSKPIMSVGENIFAEATIKSLMVTDDLTLEFWVETPSGKSGEIAKVALKNLKIGEESRYTIEIKPKETGFYNIYAYLYDGWKRIDYKLETIYVQKQ